MGALPAKKHCWLSTDLSKKGKNVNSVRGKVEMCSAVDALSLPSALADWVNNLAKRRVYDPDSRLVTLL